MGEAIAEAFARVVELAEALGVSRINEVEGCWEHSWGDWLLAVNGHKEEQRASDGAPVPPYHAYMAYARMPAALLSPAGGMTIGGSEDDLIKALQDEIAAQTVTQP